jgi:hypothetical protein
LAAGEFFVSPWRPFISGGGEGVESGLWKIESRLRGKKAAWIRNRQRLLTYIRHACGMAFSKNGWSGRYKRPMGQAGV